MKSRIFLGGTCGKSTWRNQLISKIKVNYFNPLVENWTEECQAIEEDEKTNKCDVHFYCITKEMFGVYSIAEVVDSANQKSKTTILQVIPDGFDEHQIKSLKAVCDLIKRNGGIAFMDSDLDRSANLLNSAFA